MVGTLGSASKDWAVRTSDGGSLGLLSLHFPMLNTMWLVDLALCPSSFMLTKHRLAKVAAVPAKLLFVAVAESDFCLDLQSSV